jgi:hypothetical protein
MYLAPLAGLPRFDMASAIGGFLGEPAPTLSFGWWIGRKRPVKAVLI